MPEPGPACRVPSPHPGAWRGWLWGRLPVGSILPGGRSFRKCQVETLLPNPCLLVERDLNILVAPSSGSGHIRRAPHGTVAVRPGEEGRAAFLLQKAKAEDEKPLLLRAPQAGIAQPPGPSCPGCELGSLERHAPSAREGRASWDGQWARLCGGGGDSRCPRWTGQHVCAERCPSPLVSCLTVTHPQMYVVREVPGVGVRPPH